jgi:YHS domain-containing protein
LALDGYCPVNLAQKKRWVKGDRQWSVVYRGLMYLCGGPEEARQFCVNPDAYAPVASGIDLVAAVDRDQVVPGRREHGTWYGGRLYLFASETTHQLFERYPERYASAAPPMATSPFAGNTVRRN